MCSPDPAVKEIAVEFGRECDLDQWMDLVAAVSRDFPGLETGAALEEHRHTVLGFMRAQSAICAKSGGLIVGTLLFSKETSTLCFLAVAPLFRRQHIAEKMVSLMLQFMDPGKDVTVSTYRAGVPEGRAARAFYKRLGFTEGRLTEEFGSPVQELILRRQRPPANPSAKNGF